MRVTSQLVAGILHEFNSPLGALRSSLDTARLGLERIAASLEHDPDEVRRLVALLAEILVVAHTASDRIQDTVETLAHFARVDRADVDTIELGQVVDTALRLSGALRRKIGITRQFDPALTMRCRVREVEHVLFHLLRNATEALDHTENPRIEITASRPAAHVVEIVVKDNGPGIDPGELSTLFEPTLTIKGGTVGLGMSLATCRYLAQEHGGTVEGGNASDGGARFVFRFREEDETSGS